jgi:hypothetical protein
MSVNRHGDLLQAADRMTRPAVDRMVAFAHSSSVMVRPEHRAIRHIPQPETSCNFQPIFRDNAWALVGKESLTMPSPFQGRQ